MSEEIYSIVQLEKYAFHIREAAANTICENNNDNLDEYITINQIISLIKDKCLGFDSENRPMLNESINESIFEETAIWIESVGLAKLAAEDLVECAWDNENNEMVFWKKSNEPKPKSRRKRKNS